MEASRRAQGMGSDEESNAMMSPLAYSRSANGGGSITVGYTQAIPLHQLFPFHLANAS